MSATYADVDASPDRAAMAVAWQERLTQWPAIKAYKDRSRELLGGQGPFLDLGCGPGADVVALGVQNAIGVDASQVMCTTAQRRGASVCRADAAALPFAADVFGGVRADRLVQHVAAPGRVLDEMVRVTRPAGRVLVADPDQETLVIHVPGVRQSVLDRVRAIRRDFGYRNGRLASRLPDLFLRMGLRDVSVEAFALVLTDPADAFGLPSWPRTRREAGGFTDEELEEWDAAMRAGPDGFVYAVSYLVVAGTKP